jgi:hypothetical protein
LKSIFKNPLDKDKELRRKRLEITRQVQIQNQDLMKWKNENERVNQELSVAIKREVGEANLSYQTS